MKRFVVLILLGYLFLGIRGWQNINPIQEVAGSMLFISGTV
jgi:hypothetical protein